jgi:uncharacterized coiled-coil protein SlyX
MAVSGKVILLKNDQALRAFDASGSPVSLFKLDPSSKLQLLTLPQVSSDPTEANDLIRKSFLDSSLAVRDGRLTAVEGRATTLEGEMSVVQGADSVDGSIAKAKKDALAYVDQQITALVNGAPDMLATLKKLADAIANDPQLAAHLSAQIAGLGSRLDVIEGGESVSGSIAYQVAQERLRALGIEGGLRSDLDGEIAARQSSVTAEQTRAMGVEGQLRTDLNQEISDRQSAEQRFVTIDGQRNIVGPQVFGGTDPGAPSSTVSSSGVSVTDGSASSVYSQYGVTADWNGEHVELATTNGLVLTSNGATYNANTFTTQYTREPNEAGDSAAVAFFCSLTGETSPFETGFGIMSTSRDVTSNKAIGMIASHINLGVEDGDAVKFNSSTLWTNSGFEGSEFGSIGKVEGGMKVAATEKLVLDGLSVDVSSKKIVNVADGVDPQDVVSKSQLDFEVSRATAKENEIVASVTKEVSDRTAAVSASLDSAKSYADGKVSVEQTRAMGVEAGIQQSLDSEIAARNTAETALSGRISAIENAPYTTKSYVDTNDAATLAAAKAYTDAEQARAQAAEGALGTRIDNLLSNSDPAAIDSISELLSHFEKENSDAMAAINSLSQSASSGLAQEVYDRQAAVASEQARAVSAENSIRNDLQQEISNRQSSESQITSSISAVQGLVDQQAAQITSIQGKNSEQDGRLGNIESVNSQQDQAISAVSAVNDQQNMQISTLQQKGTEYEARMAAIESKNTEEDGRLTVIEALKVAKLDYKKVVLSASDIAAGMIDLGQTIVGTPMLMREGVMGRPGEDFSFSGSMISFSGEWMTSSGVSPLAEGDELFVYFMYMVAAF